MADPIYELLESPVYDTAIRAVQDSDPALASAIFTPLFTAMLNNTHFVKLLTEQVAAQLSGHVQDKQNPHGATAEQVGADPAGSAAAVQSGLDNHTTNKSNPHGVTAAQVGAAAMEHTHTAAQVGALPSSGGTLTGDFGVGPGRWSPRFLVNNEGVFIGDGSYQDYRDAPIALLFNGHSFVPAPTDPTDAANKQYVDSKGIQYGTCSSAAHLAIKDVQLDGFALVNGAIICVKFDYTNTYANGVMMNVNRTGSKSMYFKGLRLVCGMISANSYALFRYTGSAWELLNPLIAPFIFTDKTVSAFEWSSDTTYSAQGYNWRAAVACAGVTAHHCPDVTFACTDAVSGNFAPIAESYTGGVYIYCKTKPTATMTIPAIVCARGA